MIDLASQYPAEPEIFMDLDGVGADFFGFARGVLKADYRDMPPGEAWARLALVPNLFSQLAVLPGARDLVAALAHHGKRFKVLTAKPLPTGFLVTAEQDKREWVATKLLSTLEVLTILGGVNKFKFARPGSVLIDDLARNLGPWEEAGGIGILHTDVPSTLAKLREMGLLLPGM